MFIFEFKGMLVNVQRTLTNIPYFIGIPGGSDMEYRLNIRMSDLVGTNSLHLC